MRVQSLGIVPKNIPKEWSDLEDKPITHTFSKYSALRFLWISFKPGGQNCCVITEQFLYFGDEVPMTYVTAAAAAVLPSTLSQLNN